MLSTHDKAFYDREGMDDSDYNLNMFRYAESCFNLALPILKDRLPAQADSILEIGAGSGSMGIQISKLLGIQRSIYTDISSLRLQHSYDLAAQYFHYCAPDVDLIELDMNLPFDLPDDMADIVLFNASLHHARNIWNCLAESFRVLKPGGRLIAMRESMSPALWSRRRYEYLLNTPEVRAGVSENSYTVEQYVYYLRANGFRAEAVPFIYPNARLKSIKRLLPFTNGLIFSGSYILFGIKD
jgi:ubiquinone/menaquinone biosynthesis C-methylase UbiE